MRVLLTFLTFGRDVFGGIERATVNFAHGLRDAGADVFVYTSPAYARGGVDAGIHIRTSALLPSSYDGNDATLIRHLTSRRAQIIAEYRDLEDDVSPDLVVSVDHLWGILPALAVRARCEHAVWLHVFHNAALLKETMSATYRLYAVSATLIQQCRAVADQAIVVLPNSVVLRDFSIPRSPEGIIFCNARLSPEKRTLDAVRAFERFHDEHPNFRLHLAAAPFPFGSEKETRALVANYIAPMLLPVVFREDGRWNRIPSFLTTCDALLLATQFETFGMAALEAMAAGVPLVASRAGNLPALTAGSADLSDIGDIEGLASGLERAVRGLTDTALGRSIAQNYDHVAVARTFLTSIF